MPHSRSNIINKINNSFLPILGQTSVGKRCRSSRDRGALNCSRDTYLKVSARSIHSKSRSGLTGQVDGRSDNTIGSPITSRFDIKTSDAMIPYSLFLSLSHLSDTSPIYTRSLFYRSRFFTVGFRFLTRYLLRTC
ncbi:hypothetical protein BDW68DRAFT_56807 [Aspergillus falconensis]